MLGLTRVEMWSVVVTAALAFIFIAIAYLSFGRSPMVLAVSLGSVGGLMHELAQSGGKVLFFTKKDDGLYLGGVAGMLLGGVTGLIAAHGMAATPSVPGAIPFMQYDNLAYESFMAGMGLKGLVEAAAGTPVAAGSGGGQPPSTTKNQPLIGLPSAPTSVPVPSF
jgi:hypothetical protein